MLAATVMTSSCFRKKMHSVLAVFFISFLSILDLWHYVQFLKSWFNTVSWCQKGALSCRRAQLSVLSDAETFPVFEKKNSLRYDSPRCSNDSCTLGRQREREIVTGEIKLLIRW